MFYFLLLSNACNLRCKYCSEKAFEDCDIKFPEEIEELNNEIMFTTKDLRKFLQNDKNHYLIFYGGPTVRINLMKKIIDEVKDTNTKYVIQTNGILLDKIPAKYLKKFVGIFVSLDGDKRITDENRGMGTYNKIMKNIKFVRENGYKKEITARMVINEKYS